MFTRHRQGFRFHLAAFRNRFQRVRVTFSRNFDPISYERKGVLRLFCAVFNSLWTPVKTARSWLVWRGLMVIYLLNNITTIDSEYDWNCSVCSAWKCYETSNVILIYVNMRYSSYWFVPMVHEEILVYMNPGSLLFETYFMNAGQTWKYFPSRAFHGFMAASAWDVGISLAGSNSLSRRSVLSVMFQFPILFSLGSDKVDSKF